MSEDDEAAEERYSVLGAAKIAKCFPWVGNPFDLPLDWYKELWANVFDVKAWLDGLDSTPEYRAIKDQQKWFDSLRRKQHG